MNHYDHNDDDSNSTDEAVLKTALEYFDSAQQAYETQRAEARDDLQFVAGNQYTTSIPGDDDYRLTVNLLGPFVRQITSEARTMNPSIRVVPVSSDQDVDTADVMAGLIRHIEQKSSAESAYQTALWYAAASGEGYILLDSEYVSPDSWDQELVIRECDSPEKVFLDPNHVSRDGSDSEWGFIVEDIDHGTFRRKYPESRLASSLANNQWPRLNLARDWLNDRTVRVARYWCKEYVKKRVWLVMDPITGQSTSVTEKPGPDVVLLRKQPRISYDVTVRARVLTAHEVLEETTWPGQHIPIIKVVGETYSIGGQRVQYGAVRMAKDPQRQYNYAVSKQTEMIDMAPKNSWVITDKQMGNHAEKWANSNRVNYGALPYVNDAGAPPPQRVSGLNAQAFSAVAAGRQQSLEDIKLVFGLNDASLGRPGNETSGVGIQARVEQSSRSTYQYFDNLLQSLRYLGRQIVDVLPVFYDTERTIRIVKPTTEEETVLINSMTNNFKYDFSHGQYDVVVSTGPAYASRRQETFDALSGILQTQPTAPIGDLIASQVDNPVAKLAAKRIKATIPPEILAATGEDNRDDMAPRELVNQLQQQMAQMQMASQKTELEKQELEIKVRILEDKSAFELAKLDVQGNQDQRQLEFEKQKAQAEMEIRMRELDLKEEQLELARVQMTINAARAAHDVMPDHVSLGDMNIGSDSELGGKIN